MRHNEDKKSISEITKYFVTISLKEVTDFDYSTICILVAIINDLKAKDVSLRAFLPNNKKCKEEIMESGLLDMFYNNLGKAFEKSKNSDLLFIEKGSKRFTRDDNIKISNKVKTVVGYTGDDVPPFPVMMCR